MGISGGDLYLAKEYLERVASSNAEDVMKATELLKAVKLTLQAKDQNGVGVKNPISQSSEGETSKRSESRGC
jgi:anaphase-promoting complex subunit 8